MKGRRMALLWTGTKVDYDAWMASRRPLPPVPRKAVPIPVPHAVDATTFDTAKAQTSVRMANHHQPVPDEDQDAYLQRCLNQVDEAEGRGCGALLRQAAVRLTKARLAVLKETIREYQ